MGNLREEMQGIFRALMVLLFLLAVLIWTYIIFNFSRNGQEEAPEIKVEEQVEVAPVIYDGLMADFPRYSDGSFDFQQRWLDEWDLPGTLDHSDRNRLHDLTVVIDPGHGSVNDSGQLYNIGATGNLNGITYYEYQLTLEYGCILREFLEAAGFNVKMLRDENTPLWNNGLPGTDRPDDNKARAETANNLGADFFLRIHFNGSEDDLQSGFSCYYNDQSMYDSDGNLENMSRYLAELTRDAFTGSGYTIMGDGVFSFDERIIYGFKYIDACAVIYEYGFMSNAEDMKNILSEEYKISCCTATAEGLIGAVREYYFD